LQGLPVVAATKARNGNWRTFIEGWSLPPVVSPGIAASIQRERWHAYRRALATNLHELGVPDIVIQAILRHEDIRTTQRSYIKTVPRVVTAP
jgi:integrase